MGLPADLQQFKASGAYRILYDRSQVITPPASEIIPLIIGFSVQGLFNIPVYCPNSDFFISIFGNIDTKMERRGSFFHRSCLTCLEEGPIIALNLYNLKNEEPTTVGWEADTTLPTDLTFDYDITNWIGLSTASTVANNSLINIVYSRLFNRDKFWFPDTEKLVNISGAIETRNLLNFTNIGKKSISIIARKSQARGYNVTMAEWYGSGNVPEYAKTTDLVSDYMIDVYVFEGDFSDYNALSLDPVFGPYFDKVKGLKKDKIDEFTKLSQVSFISFYTGSLIPDFASKFGDVLFIETLINQDTSRTGLFCAVDKEKFDKYDISGIWVDLIGHNIEYSVNNVTDFNTINFLSYKEDIVSDVEFDSNTFVTLDLNGATENQVNTSDILHDTLQAVDNNVAKFEAEISGGSFKIWVGRTYGSSYLYNRLVDTSDTDYLQHSSKNLKIWGALSNGTNVVWLPMTTQQIVNGVSSNDGIMLSVSVTGTYLPYAGYAVGDTADIFMMIEPNVAEIVTIGGFDTIVGTEYSSIGTSYFNNVLADGDIIESEVTVGLPTPDTTYYLKFVEGTMNDLTFKNNYFGNLNLGIAIPSNITIFEPANYIETQAYILPLDDITTSQDDIFATGDYYLSDGTLSTSDFAVQTLKGSLNNAFQVYTTTEDNQFEINIADGASFRVGDYVGAKVEAGSDFSRLTRIRKVQTIPTDVTRLLVITDEIPNIYTIGLNDYVERYKKIEDFIDAFEMFHLAGFRVRERLLPVEDIGHVEIYDTLTSTNLLNALADKDLITFRYIVDTFNRGIETGSKGVLFKLAQRRENAIVIANAPTIKEFSKSTDPRFTDLPTNTEPNPSVQAKWITEGGNPLANPILTYSLPSETDGAAYGAFYSPNVLIRERGRNISVPPAAYVCNLYLRKNRTDNPWSIVAGARRGVVTGKSMVGLDYQWDTDDREYLEPFGINPIVNKKGVGLQITSNSTAKQVIKSALSQIHVIEAIIYIQDGIANILKDYVWEFNTPQNRLEIVTLADRFMEGVFVSGGVYDYRNKMDSSNNDSDVIDANMGVLDTYIEPVKGMGVIVHRTTILKTGQIQTGQFI